MQIHKLLCIIHKFVNIVYEKTVYDDIILSESLGINIKTYLFA